MKYTHLKRVCWLWLWLSLTYMALAAPATAGEQPEQNAVVTTGETLLEDGEQLLTEGGEFLEHKGEQLLKGGEELVNQGQYLVAEGGESLLEQGEELIDEVAKTAGSIAKKVKEGKATEQGAKSNFSWQLTGGFSLTYDPGILVGYEPDNIGNIIGLSLLVDLYYKGFFIQSNHRRADSVIQGSELGYQIIDQADWGLDVLTRSYFMGFSPHEMQENYDKEIPELDGLEDRWGGTGLALRYSRYLDNAIFTLDFARVSAKADTGEWLVDTFYSHLHQYRNWDIYLGAGFMWLSQGTVDHLYGIDADEANEFRHEYNPGAGYQAELEVFAQHPLSEDWFFNAGFTLNHYSKSISDSPITIRQNAIQATMGVRYVF